MNKVFDENIKAIDSIKATDLSNIIKESSLPEWVSLIKGKNGKIKNFIVKNGAEYHLNYDEQNPEKSTKKFFEGKKFYKQDATVLIGSGAGYLVNELLKKKEKDHHVILIEPEAYFLKMSLERFDWSKEIKDSSLIIISQHKNTQDEMKNVIRQIFAILENRLVIENWYFMADKYTLNKQDVYSDSMKFASDIINQIQCNTGTVIGAGKIIAENDITGLPYIIRHRGVEEIKGLFNGKPAIIVSTGPSLEKNIHYILENQGKAIIIAVAQAYRGLLAYGIKPDFICTVDYGAVNYEHFQGLMEEKDVCLVALNKTYAPILKEWSGPKLIAVGETANITHEKSISRYMTKKGSLEQGGSVSHFSLGLAFHLGCNPVMMTGQDLAYEGTRSHSHFADASGEIQMDQNGQINWEIKDQESLLAKDKTHSMGGIVMVEGYFGGIVPTNVGLASFISSFSTLADTHPETKIYNCTEGGAKIKGIENLSLKKGIADYCKEEIDKTKIKDFFSFIPDYDEDIKNCLEILEYEITLLNDVIENSEKGIDAANKIIKENRRVELVHLLSENERFSTAAHEAAKKHSMMGIFIYEASRKIFSREMNKGKKDIDTLLKSKKDREERVKRNLYILEAAKSGAEKLKEMFNATISILKEYQEKKDPAILCSPKKYYPDIFSMRKDIENKNWARPLIYARKMADQSSDPDISLLRIIEECEKMKEESIRKAKILPDKTNEIEHKKLIEKSQVLGKEKKFEEVLKVLEEADRICPNNPDSKWGLATTYHFLGKIEEAAEAYESLLKSFPDNKRFKFEYAQVLLQKESEKGIALLKEIFAETTEFDSFLIHYGDLLFHSGKHQEAYESFVSYTQKFPMNPKGWIKRGSSEMILGMVQEADISMRKVHDLGGMVSVTSSVQ